MADHQTVVDHLTHVREGCHIENRICLISSKRHIDGLVQDCSNSIDNALEILQFYTEPLLYK